MNFLDTISDVWSLRGDDPCRRRPARRQWRGGHDHGAITLDENGFVVDMNAAAQAILDDNVKIRDRRIFLRDTKSRGRLKEAIDSLRMTGSLKSWGPQDDRTARGVSAVEPLVVIPSTS